jgi:hypothetical protein
VSQTATTRKRRSGRIPRHLPVQVSGIDAMGRDFTTPAHTVLLSRYGAEIVLKNELVPDQEVSICLLGNAHDWDARIVGLFSKRPDGFSYGIEFLFQDANFWGISFPPAAGSSAAEAPANGKPQPTGAKAAPNPLDDEIDFDKLLRKVRSTAAPKNYALRLKCPHLEAHGGGGALPGSEDDQWLILHHRQESLKQILETAWDFTCPIHGAMREFPLEAKQIDDSFEIRLNARKLQAAGSPATGKHAAAAPKPRREPRVPEVLRVWVRGIDLNGNPFRQSANSVDISRSGARLDGLGLNTLPGTTIEVRRNWRKALFRIVWTGKRGTAQASHVGIVCLEPGKSVWNIPDKN